MRPDLLHRLDDVQRVLAGPLTLKPLDVLVAARELLVHEMIDLNAHAAQLAAATADLNAVRAIGRRNLATVGPLGRDYPALDRWRRLVLSARTGRTPLERAAAWELQALACDVAGDPYLAHRARLAAAQIVEQGLPHGSKHPPKKDHAA